MNLIIAVFYRCLSSSEKGLKNSSLNGDSNPDLYDVGCQCNVPPVESSSQLGPEQVVMWVDYKPVDVEIDNDNTGIFHIFELRIGMNDFDPGSLLSLL